MKANFLLGKKQVILAALVLILGAAVYLNWQFANADGGLSLAAESQPDTEQVNAGADTEDESLASSSAQEEAESETKILGEAQLVSSQGIVNETYFAQARLARTKSRDEAIETISTILDNENLTADEKTTASAKAVALTDIIEAESRIENLIKAKGVSECVVYISDSAANVVVKTDGLSAEQATQIKNIVVGEGNIKGESVTITEVK